MSVLSVDLTANTFGYSDLKPFVDQEFFVQTDSLINPTGDAITAVLALGYPFLGAYVQNISSESVKGDARHVVVKVHFAPWIRGDTLQPNPLLRPSVITGSWDEESKPYIKDADNKPQTNSSGEPFDNPKQRKYGRPVLQIAKNLPSFPLLSYDAIKYTTNRSAVTIRGLTFAARTLLFLPPTGNEVWENQQGSFYHYYKTSFRLATDHLMHVDTIADRGSRKALTRAGGITLTSAPIYDTKDGKRVIAKNWPLDGAGAPKADRAAEPATLTFRPYHDAEWGLSFD